MFTKCKSLKSLPDFSKWELSNDVNRNSMFLGVNVNVVPEEFKNYM